MPDVAEEQERAASFDGARLLRFAESLDAFVEELRSMAPGALGVERLEPVVKRMLAEAEEVVPEPLLPEMHALVGPIRETETEQDLRILLVELDGWLRGFLASLGISFSVPGAPDQGT